MMFKQWKAAGDKRVQTISQSVIKSGGKSVLKSAEKKYLKKYF